MTSPPRIGIGILGGTFDPIHNGHLALARRFIQLLQLTELVLLPAGQPWQKAQVPVTSADYRLAMTRLAVKQLVFSHTSVKVATDEIEEASPTYTVDTLAKWRKRIGWQPSLSLLIGVDQLLRLESWHHWRALFDYAHLCVAARPGFTLASVSPTLAVEITRRQADVQAIRAQPYGLILIDTARMPNISSTQIRQSVPQLIASNQKLKAVPVPNAVWHYICQHHLYRT